MHSRRLGKGENNESIKVKTKIQLLRTSTCIDIIEQLDGGTSNLDNTKLGCSYCIKQLSKSRNYQKRTNSNNIRYQCEKTFLDPDDSVKNIIPILQYNRWSDIIDLIPIKDVEESLYPVKRNTISDPPLLSSNVSDDDEPPDLVNRLVHRLQQGF
jgi:protein tyrosine phosphatase